MIKRLFLQIAAICFCIFPSSFLFSERLLDEKTDEPVFVEDNFAYFAFNLTPIPYPAPGFSIGVRGGYPNFRLDADIETFLFVKKALLRANFKALWYFNPMSRHAFYTGAGYAPGFLTPFTEFHPRYMGTVNVYLGDQMSLSRKKTYFLQFEADFNTNSTYPAKVFQKLPILYIFTFGKAF